MAITGECFCGAITYRLSGKLRDAKSCHCSRCRKAFSAQASATAMVDPKDFKWTSGESNLSSFVGEHGFGYQFCKTCGSTLCTVYKNEVLQVMLGCVNGDPEITIEKHIYVGSKAGWEVLPGGVALYKEDSP